MTNNARNSSNENLTLVLTASGKTGRRVAERLEVRGVPVRRGSRSGEIPFDWDDPETWEPALADVKAAYVVYTPDLAVPAAPPAIRDFTELAVRSGVKKLVLLSGRGEEEAQRCERIVQESGVDWTIVRASWFNQNFSEGAEAAGRPIQYVQIPQEAFVAGLTEAGVPADYIELLNYLFTTVLDGRNERLDDGVQRALGREPRDFREYARGVAATGVWNGLEQGS